MRRSLFLLIFCSCVVGFVFQFGISINKCHPGEVRISHSK